jgi:hypothetical protein
VRHVIGLLHKLGRRLSDPATSGSVIAHLVANRNLLFDHEVGENKCVNWFNCVQFNSASQTVAEIFKSHSMFYA